MLWHYAKGKPKEPVDLNVTSSNLEMLSNSELAARALEIAKLLQDGVQS